MFKRFPDGEGGTRPERQWQTLLHVISPHGETPGKMVCFLGGIMLLVIPCCHGASHKTWRKREELCNAQLRQPPMLTNGTPRGQSHKKCRPTSTAASHGSAEEALDSEMAPLQVTECPTASS